MKLFIFAAYINKPVPKIKEECYMGLCSQVEVLFSVINNKKLLLALQ